MILHQAERFSSVSINYLVVQIANWWLYFCKNSKTFHQFIGSVDKTKHGRWKLETTRKRNWTGLSISNLIVCVCYFDEEMKNCTVVFPVATSTATTTVKSEETTGTFTLLCTRFKSFCSPKIDPDLWQTSLTETFSESQENTKLLLVSKLTDCSDETLHLCLLFKGTFTFVQWRNVHPYKTLHCIQFSASQTGPLKSFYTQRLFFVFRTFHFDVLEMQNIFMFLQYFKTYSTLHWQGWHARRWKTRTRKQQVLYNFPFCFLYIHESLNCTKNWLVTCRRFWK